MKLKQALEHINPKVNIEYLEKAKEVKINKDAATCYGLTHLTAAI